MQKKDLYILLAVTLGIILFFIVAFYVFLGAPQTEWYGFGVDSDGQVYIGRPTQIEVYQDGEYVSSIEIPKNRIYYFTVQEDDTILLSTSLNAYILDLSGRELSCKPDDMCSVFNKLQWQKEVKTRSGEIFRYQDSLGCKTIENENGEIIFQSYDYWEIAISVLFLGAIIAIGFVKIWRLCTAKVYIK